MTSEGEQYEAAMCTQAQIIASFYTALTENGVPPELAAELVRFHFIKEKPGEKVSE